MPTNLEREVSEMPCPCVATLGRCQSCASQTVLQIPLHQADCEPCQGTRLRWSPLSRECGCDTGEVRLTYTDTGNYFKTTDCSECHGSGRVPNVDLGEVLDAAAKEVGSDHIEFWTGSGASSWVCRLPRFAKDGEALAGSYDGHGKTRKEAACAALLASVKA